MATLKLVDAQTFFMSENEVRAAYHHGIVGIHYAFDSYGSDVQRVLELRKEVLKDYPQMSDQKMEVRKLLRSESIRHASLITLFVGIPIDDFLKLREEGKIDIR